jgi:hypothetical protein
MIRKLLVPLVVGSFVFSSATAFAGGPVVVEEEGQPEVVADTPRSGWIVPVIVGAIILCAIACGGDDDPQRASTDPGQT